jgi:hypothetical protein
MLRPGDTVRAAALVVPINRLRGKAIEDSRKGKLHAEAKLS